MTQVGQYRLLDKLGSSVLGAVYQAQDMATGTPMMSALISSVSRRTLPTPESVLTFSGPSVTPHS
jgi:hypothetical protein